MARAVESVRREVVVDTPCLVGALIAPEPPGWRTHFLLRRVGQPGFRPITPGTPAGRGDEVVIYRYDPGDPVALDAINQLYDARFYVDPARLDHWTIWPDEERLIAAEIPAAGARILEVACGAGRITPALARDGNDVLGIDLATASIAAATAAAPPRVRYAVGDATALPLPDGAFDLTVCLENGLGIMHRDRAPALLELFRTCRPGGTVVLGLRDVPEEDGDLFVYHAVSGHIELARTFDRAGAIRLVDTARATDPTVGRPRFVAGGPRRWGGEEYYVVIPRQDPRPPENPVR